MFHVQELTEYVLDFLSDDIPTLKSCSLVSSSWNSASSYHIFYYLQLHVGVLIRYRDEPNSPLRLPHLELRNCPRICNSVKNLSLRDHGYHIPWQTGPINGAIWKSVYSGSFRMDVVLDIISIFPYLRGLEISRRFPEPTSPKAPPLTLAPRAPTDIDEVRLRLNPFDKNYFAVHQKILQCFKTIKSLDLRELSPRGGDLPDYEVDNRTLQQRRVHGLQLEMDKDLEGGLDEHSAFRKLFTFSDVRSLFISGPMFHPIVQRRFHAIVTQTSSLLHLSIKFSYCLISRRDEIPDIGDPVNMSGFNEGLTSLVCLRSLHVDIPLYKDCTGDAPVANQALLTQKNNALINDFVAIFRMPPRLSQIRIILPNWSTSELVVYSKATEDSLANIQALNWQALDSVVECQQSLQIIEIEHPFQEESSRYMRPRVEQIIRDNVSASVRPFLRVGVQDKMASHITQWTKLYPTPF